MALATSILWAGLAMGATADFSARVEAKSGYDSNIFYGSLTQFSDLAGQAKASDVYLSLDPRVEVFAGLGPWEAGAQYALSATQFGSYLHGYTLLHHLILSQSARVGRLWLTALESGDAYAVSAFRSDTLLRGIGELQALVPNGASAFGLRLGAGPRFFPDREVRYLVTERDLSLLATTFARWSPGAWQLDAMLALERRSSNAPALEGNLWTFQASVTRPLAGVELAARSELRALSFPAFPVSDTTVGRRDLQVLLSAAARVHWGAFEPAVEAGWEAGRSNYALGGFRRWTVGLALALHWEAASGKRPPSPSAPVSRGSAAHLSVHRPEASAVWLVGSFNGWRLPGLPFRRGSEGDWDLELQLPPGRYRCQLRVDGRLEALEGAEAYAPDGMGGRDAMIVIPDASGGGLNR